MQRLKAVDLFCGCGGMSCGLYDAGFNLIAGIDSDAIALKSYAHNLPTAEAIQCDLATLPLRELMQKLNIERGALDLLVGGPPCQGFSKNVPRSKRDLSDPNNRLISVFLETARQIMPRFILMENVAEMKNGFEKTYTNLIVDLLEEYGYTVDYRVLNALDYGVPQRRKRAFFLASRDSERIIFPQQTHFANSGAEGLLETQAQVSVWNAIGDLPMLEHGEGIENAHYPDAPFHSFQEWARRDSKQIYNHTARRLQSTQYERLASLLPGQGIKDLPDKLRPKSGYSGAYGRLTKEMIAPTITRWVFHPGSGRFGHPVTPRVITIREAARLQGFPDTFRFCGTYIQQSHQVGNAVPPLLVQRIGEALLSAS